VWPGGDVYEKSYVTSNKQPMLSRCSALCVLARTLDRRPSSPLASPPPMTVAIVFYTCRAIIFRYSKCGSGSAGRS
jgi:hypothetical protein